VAVRLTRWAPHAGVGGPSAASPSRAGPTAR
jgi:hypothetical protein